MGDHSTYCCCYYYHCRGCHFIIFCKLSTAQTNFIVLFSILYIKFGFFKRKKVGEDEEDLAKWQSPNNGGEDETIPQNKGSTPASEDPTT